MLLTVYVAPMYTYRVKVEHMVSLPLSMDFHISLYIHKHDSCMEQPLVMHSALILSMTLVYSTIYIMAASSRVGMC